MRRTLQDQFRGKPPFFWVVIAAAIIGAFAWTFTWTMMFKYYGLAKDGYDWHRKNGPLQVNRVYPGGPVEGKLQVDDVIFSLNNQPVSYQEFTDEMTRMLVGTTYTLEIERNGNRQQVELKLVLHPAMAGSATNWSSQVTDSFPYSLIALCYFLVAILAGLMKPDDPAARLLFATFYCFALGTVLTVGVQSGGLVSLFNETEINTWRVIRLFSGSDITFAFLFHLFLRFPPGIPETRFWKSLKWLIYLSAGFFALIENFYSWNRTSPSVLDKAFLFILSLAIVVVAIRNYRLTTEPQQRQRIKWIINSTAAFFSGLILIILIAPSLKSRLPPGVWQIIGTTLKWVFLLLEISMPVAWAYAILKHRVLDISVVIRRSIRYLLASRGFILIEALLAFSLLSFVFAGRLGTWLDRFDSNNRTLVIIVGTVLLVLGLQYFNRKVHPLIERRFFRDAYDAQQILTELTNSLRTTTNVNQVLQLSAGIIQRALYAANVTLFLRNGKRDFSSAISSDYFEREKLSYEVARDLHLPDAAMVLQRLQDSRQPLEIDWDDPYSPVATQLAAMANGDAAAQQEFDTLRELKTNLVLPLAAKDELLGVLALGPRAGDLPYSREDKRMLMNVAGQTAMALENSRLIEQKIEIEAENARKTQELEEARRLQLSMLPKGNLRLERLEITGAMRTATEVGGDYYDFLPLPDGRYCVVIGDATGHGMSAGLIVGMVKMGLTSRLQTQPNLQPMIEDLNTALRQSLTHRGVGMCLGATIIDPVTLQVEIRSNGMPFPYHFTDGSLRAIELKAQPLGFLKHVNVPTASLQLQTGEALIWVSDGFEERMNARNEEWGAEQVALALTEICQHETSGEAIARALIAACDRASDGRNNNDDMTIVVVKVI